MKYFLQNSEKFKAVWHVLNQNRHCFTDIPFLTAALETFGNQTEEIGKLLQPLLIPVKAVNLARLEARAQLLDAFDHFLHLAYCVANQSDIQTIRMFVRRYRSVSAAQILLFTEQLIQMLNRNPDKLTGYVSDIHITDRLIQAANNYRDAINKVREAYNNRAASRHRIQQLIISNHELLRDGFDPIINSKEEEYPNCYYAYQKARWPARSVRHKKTM